MNNSTCWGGCGETRTLALGSKSAHWQSSEKGSAACSKIKDCMRPMSQLVHSWVCSSDQFFPRSASECVLGSSLLSSERKGR